MQLRDNDATTNIAGDDGGNILETVVGYGKNVSKSDTGGDQQLFFPISTSSISFRWI